MVHRIVHYHQCSLTYTQNTPSTSDDDQTVLGTSEDELQRSTHKLGIIAMRYMIWIYHRIMLRFWCLKVTVKSVIMCNITE